jgi:CRP/FNR family transcriptional regulator, cyclic AMP receptor protein
MSSNVDGFSTGWGDGAESLKWDPKSGALPKRGDIRESLFLVTSGLAFASYRAAPTLDVLAYVIGPGEWIGAERALLGVPMTVEARAVAESELLRVERQAWIERCATDAAFANAVLRQVTRRQQEILRRLSSCLTEPIEDRLPTLLWDLCRALPVGEQMVRLPFTQDALARMAGCTRMTLHRGLSSLASMGLLRLQRGAVEVPSPERLARYSGRTPAPAVPPRPQGIA